MGSDNPQVGIENEARTAPNEVPKARNTLDLMAWRRPVGTRSSSKVLHFVKSVAALLPRKFLEKSQLQPNGIAHELKIRGGQSANHSPEALLADRCQLICHGFGWLFNVTYASLGYRRSTLLVRGTTWTRLRC